MGIINDFIGFLIERKLGKEPDEGVEKKFTNQNVIDALISMDNSIGDMNKRIADLEKRVYLPSERSHTKQNECSKSSLRSEWESRNFFE